MVKVNTIERAYDLVILTTCKHGVALSIRITASIVMYDA